MSKFNNLSEIIAQNIKHVPDVSGPLWLHKLRQQSLRALRKHTLPTLKTEDWRDTNLHSLYQHAWTAAVEQDAVSAELSACVAAERVPDCHLLVMVDGFFHAGLSDIGKLPAKGVVIGNLKDLLYSAPDLVQSILTQSVSQVGRSTVFAHLNLAWLTDGMVCCLSPGLKLAKPIQILSIYTNQPFAMSHQRHLVMLGEMAMVEVIETQVSFAEKPYFCTDSIQIQLSKGACCQHIKLQNCGQAVYRLGHLFLTQAEDSRYQVGYFNLGAGLNRESAAVHLLSDQVNCQLYGLYLANQQQCLDHHFVLSHEAEFGESEQYFKGVAAQEARTIFNARVIVQPGAQKTNTNQISRNLILGRQAEVINKPELEIYADDVRCAHGAATGQVDKAALFYLQSRGIGYDQAMDMLVKAFVADVVDKIPDQDMRMKIQNLAWDKLVLQLASAR